MSALKRAPLALVLLSGPAQAHLSADALSGASLWNYDPWLAVPLYVAGIAFYAGSLRLGRVAKERAAAYWGAWSILALAFLSPLHWLSERLFAAHMAEHELLLLVAAPLFAMARPGPVAQASLPRAARRFAARARRALPRLVAPFSATLAQAAALTFWHIPRAYEWALRDPLAHRLEHISFFLAAYLFWRAILSPRTDRVAAVGCLFLTMMHSGLLGALLTLAPHPLYPAQEPFAAEFGLDPLQDQQIAGLVMWVPCGLVYAAAALWLARGLLAPRYAPSALRSDASIWPPQ